MLFQTSASLIWMSEISFRGSHPASTSRNLLTGVNLQALAVAALVVFTGCASPGPPRAPSLHLPTPATSVHAERIGGEVLVTWTTPPNTTDGDANPNTIPAVLCRQVGAPGPQPCLPVARATVAPGPSHLADPLPHDLNSGPPALLTYRVELLNSRGRSAGPSGPAFAAAGQAPSPLGELSISPGPSGPLLQWHAVTGQPPVELKRTLVDATQPPPKQKSSLPSKLNFSPRSPASAQPPGTVLLLASRNGMDPGGVLDDSVQDPHTYTYTAQRVLTIQLAGHSLELRGLPSPPITFTQRDIFPPAIPSGLVSIPAGGYGTPLSIDLSWDPGPERDLLGYNVYRSQNGGAFAQITPQPVPNPAFRDLTVAPGVAYSYRVTALDQHHNESAPSSQVHETIPADQKR